MVEVDIEVDHHNPIEEVDHLPTRHLHHHHHHHITRVVVVVVEVAIVAIV